MNKQELELASFMWASAYVYRCFLKRLNGHGLTKNERAIGLVQSVVMLTRLNNMSNETSSKFSTMFIRSLTNKINIRPQLDT